ncbi:MAG: ring canal kelch, partial [Halothiobacillaceae bacterium]
MTTPSAAPAAIRYGLLSLLFLAVTLWLLLSHTRTPPQATASAWQANWQTSAALTTARRAFAAVATATHVYAIGGMDSTQNYIATVEYAPILADGSLGHWQTTAPLNEARFYLAAVVVGNAVYALGGANGPRGSENSPSAVVERSEILPDGRLGAWQIVNELTTPRRGLQAVSHNNHLYAIGGYNGAFLKNIERADIGANGQLSTWQLETETATVDRYIHSATAYRGRIYLMAGHIKQGPASREGRYGGYGDVESAAILADGRLGPWEIEKSSLLEPRFIASAVALNGFLYLIG